MVLLGLVPTLYKMENARPCVEECGCHEVLDWGAEKLRAI